MAEKVSPMYDRHTKPCPEYEGSDFWNDPHLWCGVEATKVLCWAEKPKQACDIDADYSVSQAYWNQQRAVQNAYAGNQLANFQQSLYGQQSPYANSLQNIGFLNSPMGSIWRL